MKKPSKTIQNIKENYGLDQPELDPLIMSSGSYSEKFREEDLTTSALTTATQLMQREAQDTYHRILMSYETQQQLSDIDGRIEHYNREINQTLHEARQMSRELVVQNSLTERKIFEVEKSIKAQEAHLANMGIQPLIHAQTSMLSQVREKAGKIQDATKLTTIEDAIRRLEDELQQKEASK